MAQPPLGGAMHFQPGVPLRSMCKGKGKGEGKGERKKEKKKGKGERRKGKKIKGELTPEKSVTSIPLTFVGRAIYARMCCQCVSGLRHLCRDS